MNARRQPRIMLLMLLVLLTGSAAAGVAWGEEHDTMSAPQTRTALFAVQ